MKQPSGLRTFATLAALVLVLAWLRAAPGQVPLGEGGSSGTSEGTSDVLPGEATGASTGTAVAGKTQTGTTGGSQTGQKQGLECKAGRNGGATDVGVTANEIKVASTVVLDGPGASLLGSSPIGMRAVINKVNGAGGICGRRINLTTVNDSWDAARGRDYIRRFIEEKYFALPVVPSSEGLSEAIASGLISNAKIPVVGTDGLRIDQYKDAWTWPVSSATISSVRSMAKYAYEVKGARSFGIIWDSKYKFGVEGANAFKEYVSSLPNTTIKADIPLDPDKPSYGSEAQVFNTNCGNAAGASACDMVVMLLVPATALNWKSANPGATAGRGKLTYGAQTLFTDDFAGRCGGWCHSMLIWTGYNPPIPPLDSKPGVAQFVADVKAQSPNIDFRNQFLEGAYLGMSVFVEAVKRCSPNLTRVCVKEQLDTMDYQSDLSSTLSWRPGKHHANRSAQAFSIEATGGSFNGWRYENTGFVQDPVLGG